MLFSGGHAGREPDNFCRLSGLGQFDLGRRILVIIPPNGFLRVAGNLGDLGILYHNKEIENRREDVRNSQNSDRYDDPDFLTLTSVGVPPFLSTSDIPSIPVWVSNRSPVSSSCLDMIWEGGADSERLIRLIQSGCP